MARPASSAAIMDAAERRRERRLAEQRDGDEKVTLELRVLARTNRACLVSLDSDVDGVWIPNSQLEDMPESVGGVHSLTLPVWLATDRGLV